MLSVRIAAVVALWMNFNLAPAASAALPTDEPPVAITELSRLQPGDSWSWTYSQKQPATDTWAPYFIETYTLTKVDGKLLTFEMQSSPLPPKPSPAHHKFIVNFANCERAANGGPLNWTMFFYRRDENSRWELISNSFENFAFTEKFNCVHPTAGTIDYIHAPWNGGETTLFSSPQPSNTGPSYYFLEAEGLRAVAARKIFPPKGEYKFEFRAFTRLKRTKAAGLARVRCRDGHRDRACAGA